MDGFERRRQEKKETIMCTALELFKQYGFNKVSISDIASKASVSQVSIYNFFQSKENLKNEVLKNLWENYYQSIISIINNNDETIQDKIEKFFYTVIDYTRNYTTNFMTASIRNQIAKEEITAEMQMESIEKVIITLLKQGQKEGVIKSTITLNAMVNYIEMFRFYIINNPEAAINYDRNPELLKEIVSLYLNALFT